MKANEAPEKIYLPYKDDRLIGLVKTEGVKFNSGVDGHIEYTRTDAFMKKAENFLEMLGYGFTITDNITHANYDKEQLIEDFRNYMKGE